MGPLQAILFDDRRHRRVAELITVLWILGLADLCFTLWAHLCTPFNELNPVAAYMLRRNLLPTLILYKLVVTGIGTMIFWRLRNYGRAEIALWGVVAAYVVLAMRWSDYTSTVLAMI